MSDEPTPYALGWDDGYSEGYACKLADATEPFNPASLSRADAVTLIAALLQKKHAVYFASDSDAIGAARQIVTTLNEDKP